MKTKTESGEGEGTASAIERKDRYEEQAAAGVEAGGETVEQWCRGVVRGARRGC